MGGMKDLNVKSFIFLLVVVSAIIWIAIQYVNSNELRISWTSLKYVPTVVSIDAMLWILFAKWGWKNRIFQKWLVPFPCLEGTWEGSIQTTWTDPKTRDVPTSIPVILVIKQSFISISCVMHSQEMISRSYTADFLIGLENNLKKITYTYTSSPRVSVRERSVVHDGTALLEIITNPSRALRGEYWTNRKSTGEIDLKFRSKELLQGFPEDLTLHAIEESSSYQGV